MREGGLELQEQVVRASEEVDKCERFHCKEWDRKNLRKVLMISAAGRCSLIMVGYVRIENNMSPNRFVEAKLV